VFAPAESVPLPDGPFTLEGWMRADGLLGRRGFLSKAERSDYGLFVSNGQPSFSVFLGQGYVTAQGRQGTLPTGSWVHLAGVFDGQEVRLYVDGRLVARAAGGGVRKTNALALLVGADPDAQGRPTSGFAGLVDEVRLSKVARYAGEAFEPARRHAPDEDTVLLLHLDGRLGPFAPDHAPGRRHAFHARRVEYVPVADGTD
jgi:hypothetical protein